jgi:hypothetical protein
MFSLNLEKTYSENIVRFDENFALNFFGNYNVGMFIHNYNSENGYSTNEPWDIGIGLRYKEFSAQILIPLSFDIKSFDLDLNLYFEKLHYEIFYKHYPDFYTKGDSNNIGLDVMSAGIKADWVQDYENHSLSSVFNLDKIQNISTGSFIYGFGVFYSSIQSNNETLNYYRERQNFVYFGPSAGYSFTWIFRHNVFLNLSLNVAANLGINSSMDNKILFIPQIEPNIVIGHHNRTWSINIKTMCNSTILLWGEDNFAMLGLATATIMFSKRF